MDRYGTRNVLIVALSLVCIGSTIITIGGYKKSFDLMLLGRAIYGMGSETTSGTQSTFVSQWFFDVEQSLAMGLSMSVPYVVSFWGGSQNYANYKSGGIGYAFALDTVFCVFSLITGIVLFFLDRWVKKEDCACTSKENNDQKENKNLEEEN